MVDTIYAVECRSVGSTGPDFSASLKPRSPKRVSNTRPGPDRAALTMQVQPYQTCQDCGAPLQTTTVYRRHAVCGECTKTPA